MLVSRAGYLGKTRFVVLDQVWIISAWWVSLCFWPGALASLFHPLSLCCCHWAVAPSGLGMRQAGECESLPCVSSVACLSPITVACPCVPVLLLACCLSRVWACDSR